MSIAYYNNLKDNIKINLSKLLFFVMGAFGETKLEHDFKMLLSGIKLRK